MPFWGQHQIRRWQQLLALLHCYVPQHRLETPLQSGLGQAFVFQQHYGEHFCCVDPQIYRRSANTNSQRFAVAVLRELSETSVIFLTGRKCRGAKRRLKRDLFLDVTVLFLAPMLEQELPLPLHSQRHSQ